MNERSIFAAAIEIADPAERSGYLSQACGENLDLRRQIEELLEAQNKLGSFLARPIAGPPSTAGLETLADGPGTRIGPYKLLQQIGEGGMGVVYMAEQERPVRRKVALKVIKPGMDSAQVIARFEAERQALAVLDHTNIAKVFDAGQTESGRPFFVMELVHGVPITGYCDHNQLTTRERLELFIPICLAIQHAHQKGIIHRDIKPSNVLVTMYDDKPVPKVIDFGVAKAVEQRLTERTLFTQYGALVGTFEYMSPEQAEMNAFGVDTRSDIYALGVLLYELLTGTTPLERARLRAAALGEIVRLIKEEEPPRPSVRLSSSGELPTIAAARKTEPARLSKIVRGEVDWIVMKCLEKDRARRYGTASDLARDLERHLRDERVEACPPSTLYRIRKVARRYRAPVAVAGGFVVLLLSTAILSSWLAVEASRAQRLAVYGRRAAVVAEAEAREQRDQAEKARESLRRSLYASDLQLAQSAWSSGNVSRMQNLLEKERPAPGEADLRGFEWYYLRRLGSLVQTTPIVPDYDAGALSPDGKRYVARAQLVTNAVLNEMQVNIKCVDVSTKHTLHTIAVSAGDVYRWPFVFSLDSKSFGFQDALRDRNGKLTWQLHVWDWETGRELGSVSGLGIGPEAKALDQEAGHVALAFNDHGGNGGCALKVQEVKGGKECCTIAIANRWITGPQALAFSPDGTHLAAMITPPDLLDVGSGGEVRIWNARSGKQALKFAAGFGSIGLAYRPDGKLLAAAGGRGASHRIWDAGSGREVLELNLAESDDDARPTIAFSPDGLRLAAVTHTGLLRVWELTDAIAGGGRPPELVAGASNMPLENPAWSADGQSVSASAIPGSITTWRVDSRRERTPVPEALEGAYVNGAAASPTLSFAATLEVPGDKLEVRAWDDTGKVLLKANEDISGSTVLAPLLRLSRDGGRLAVLAWTRTRSLNASSERSRLRVWDLATSRELLHRDVDLPSSDSAMALSPDGRLLAISTVSLTGDNPERAMRLVEVSVWDLASGREQRKLDFPSESEQPWVSGLAFSPDGRRLAAGCTFNLKGELRVWDIATGSVILKRSLAGNCNGSPAYSVDGRLLAVGMATTTEAVVVNVLDASSGKDVCVLAGQRFPIQKLIFSPDGRRLASSAKAWSPAAEIKLWDLAGGGEMLSFQSKSTGTLANDSLAFSPDGRRLFYIPGGSGRDAEMRVWDARPIGDESADSRQ
jgi:serine/threonine protein kinase/WD40 repeat protein